MSALVTPDQLQVRLRSESVALEQADLLIEAASDVAEAHAGRRFLPWTGEREFELDRLGQSLVVVGTLRSIDTITWEGGELDADSVKLRKLDWDQPAYSIKLPYSIEGGTLAIAGDWGWPPHATEEDPAGVPKGVQRAVLEICAMAWHRDMARMADVTQSADQANMVQLSRKAIPPLAALYLTKFRIPAIG